MADSDSNIEIHKKNPKLSQAPKKKAKAKHTIKRSTTSELYKTGREVYKPSTARKVHDGLIPTSTKNRGEKLSEEVSPSQQRAGWMTFIALMGVVAVGTAISYAKDQEDQARLTAYKDTADKIQKGTQKEDDGMKKKIEAMEKEINEHKDAKAKGKANKKDKKQDKKIKSLQKQVKKLKRQMNEGRFRKNLKRGLMYTLGPLAATLAGLYFSNEDLRKLLRNKYNIPDGQLAILNVSSVIQAVQNAVQEVKNKKKSPWEAMEGIVYTMESLSDFRKMASLVNLTHKVKINNTYMLAYSDVQLYKLYAIHESNKAKKRLPLPKKLAAKMKGMPEKMKDQMEYHAFLYVDTMKKHHSIIKRRFPQMKKKYPHIFGAFKDPKTGVEYPGIERPEELTLRTATVLLAWDKIHTPFWEKYARIHAVRYRVRFGGFRPWVWMNMALGRVPKAGLERGKVSRLMSLSSSPGAYHAELVRHMREQAAFNMERTQRIIDKALKKSTELRALKQNLIAQETKVNQAALKTFQAKAEGRPTAEIQRLQTAYEAEVRRYQTIQGQFNERLQYSLTKADQKRLAQYTQHASEDMRRAGAASYALLKEKARMAETDMIKRRKILETKKAQIQADYDNKRISRGEYRSKIAALDKAFEETRKQKVAELEKIRQSISHGMDETKRNAKIGEWAEANKTYLKKALADPDSPIWKKAEKAFRLQKGEAHRIVSGALAQDPGARAKLIHWFKGNIPVISRIPGMGFVRSVGRLGVRGFVLAQAVTAYRMGDRETFVELILSFLPGIGPYLDLKAVWEGENLAGRRLTPGETLFRGAAGVISGVADVLGLASAGSSYLVHAGVSMARAAGKGKQMFTLIKSIISSPKMKNILAAYKQHKSLSRLRKEIAALETVNKGYRNVWMPLIRAKSGIDKARGVVRYAQSGLNVATYPMIAYAIAESSAHFFGYKMQPKDVATFMATSAWGGVKKVGSLMTWLSSQWGTKKVQMADKQSKRLKKAST